MREWRYRERREENRAGQGKAEQNCGVGQKRERGRETRDRRECKSKGIPSPKNRKYQNIKYECVIKMLYNALWVCCFGFGMHGLFGYFTYGERNNSCEEREREREREQDGKVLHELIALELNGNIKY